LIESECGNGDLEPGEQCDDGDLDAGDGCSPECTFEGCGNGIDDAGLEECDRTDPGNTESRCRWDCTIWFCGDGTVDSDEQCDGGVGCDENCQRTTDCGDGTRDPGDECDDGNEVAGRVLAATFAHTGRARLWRDQPVGTVDDVVERLAPFVELGYRHLVAGFPAPFDEESMTRLAGEVRPALERL
jgi:cysteine-rich repeat protein